MNRRRGRNRPTKGPVAITREMGGEGSAPVRRQTILHGHLREGPVRTSAGGGESGSGKVLARSRAPLGAKVAIGHRCFGKYLYPIGCEEMVCCHHCDGDTDTTQHMLEICPERGDQR